MEGQKYTITEEQLIRYCEGNVSEEEYRIIMEWLASSEENTRILRQIQAISLASDTIRLSETLDTEKALSAVHSHMKIKLSRWHYIERIAAILFLPLLLLYTFTFLPDGKQETAEIMQVKSNPGMTTRLILPDGTIAHLNSETTLQYPSSFSKDSRNVHLNGEAYFEVKKSREQNFIVSTPCDARIEVLGTHFNVEAYENKPFVAVTLTEGKVNFLFKENTRYKKLAMQPGHKVIYEIPISTPRLYRTAGHSETAWTTGKIIFENTPFREALHMLEKRYHVEFVVKNDRFDDDSFSGEFTAQRLDRILEHFKLSTKIYWRYLETNEKDEKTKIEIY